MRGSVDHDKQKPSWARLTGTTKKRPKQNHEVLRTCYKEVQNWFTASYSGERERVVVKSRRSQL